MLPFNKWFDRILSYGFEENIDYTSFTKNLVSGGKTKEYAITLDMAKEISMIQSFCFLLLRESSCWGALSVKG
jgi:phage anti-repressor protein